MEIASPVALVLCGGSSRGALEVGLYRAVRELGLPIDLVIGSSIGALNGACIAAGMSPIELAKFPVEGAERQMTSLTSHFQNQTVREPQYWPFSKMLQRSRHRIRVLQR